MALPSDPAQMQSRRLTNSLWLLLAALLVLNIPLFLCQPLTADAVHFDLQARCALEGGALYRDFSEPNLPGMAWMHMAVRSLLGWSSAALRIVDLMVFAAIVTLLALWVMRCRPRQGGVVLPVLCLLLFCLYLSLPECCHCQRDLWMLLPALGALHLRARRVFNERKSTFDAAPPAGIWDLFGVSVIEGCLWGAAFWMKPHIAIPAVCVLALSGRLTDLRRRFLTDLAGVLCGGLLMGAVGSIALIQMGSWPSFWDTLLHWNPEYVQAGRKKISLSRLMVFWDGLAPWSYLTAAGLALALYTLGQSLRRRAREPVSRQDLYRWLLCALFTAWVVQALTLQHPLPYVYVPLMVLGGTLCLLWPIPPRLRMTAAGVVVWFALQGLIGSPLVQPARLAAWRDCMTQGPTIAVRSRVQVETQPDWNRLLPVIEFLKRQNLKQHELTAYTGGLVHLYPELGLLPSTRYVYVNVLAIIFRSHLDEIHKALEKSPQRFIVSNLRELGMSSDCIAEEDDPLTGLPVSFPSERLAEFPFTQPVIFRSGEYVVHRARGPIGPLCTQSGPLVNVRPRHLTSSARSSSVSTSAAAKQPAVAQ